MTHAVVTGGDGFLAWHLACRLTALHGTTPVRLSRADLADPAKAAAAVGAADVVYHLAGVSRADSDAAVEEGNLGAANELIEALRRADRPCHVVYANSIQADLDNAYGRGKRAAAEAISEAQRSLGGTFADVVLPNLFGEHGRPDYNSFVATFASRVVSGQPTTVIEDREVPLLHAQRAASALIEAGDSRSDQQVRPGAELVSVSGVLTKLTEFDSLYQTGEIPKIADPFDLDLFNTYRSYTFPQRFPIKPKVHADARGKLFETLRSHGGTGQAYASTTRPGATRGEHYHLHKVERFVVVHGEAEIGFRRLLHDEVTVFRVSGSDPTILDMPTMWVHNLRNVGSDDLITFFWADQLLDPNHPDQYYDTVCPGDPSP